MKNGKETEATLMGYIGTFDSHLTQKGKIRALGFEDVSKALGFRAWAPSGFGV